MTYSCRILADSLSPHGVRLTTFEVTFPRFILAEFNTHGMLAKNSASSRAIPIEKMLERVNTNPFVPVSWGKNQKGMQAEEELDHKTGLAARSWWTYARGSAVSTVQRLVALGVHKQLANRLLEPWLWNTAIVSATEWENFFNLRTHKDAQPEFRVIAQMMKEAYDMHLPILLPEGAWHLPLVDWDDHVIGDIPEADLPWVSAGRCARVSYLTHEGKRDPQADIALAKRLQASGHMSPFEHVATPFDAGRVKAMERIEKEILSCWGFGLLDQEEVRRMIESVRFDGKFRGWTQLRKTLPNEAVFRG